MDRGHIVQGRIARDRGGHGRAGQGRAGHGRAGQGSAVFALAAALAAFSSLAVLVPAASIAEEPSGIEDRSLRVAAGERSPEEWIEYFEARLRFYPDDELMTRRLAEAYVSAGRYDEALERFEEIAEPDAGIRDEMRTAALEGIRSHLEAGDTPSALSIYRAYPNEIPAEGEWARPMAELAAAAGDTARAVEIYRRAAGNSDAPGRIWARAAELYLSMERTSAAKEAYVRAESAGALTEEVITTRLLPLLIEARDYRAILDLLGRHDLSWPEEPVVLRGLVSAAARMGSVSLERTGLVRLEEERSPEETLRLAELTEDGDERYALIAGAVSGGAGGEAADLLLSVALARGDSAAVAAAMARGGSLGNRYDDDLLRTEIAIWRDPSKEDEAWRTLAGRYPRELRPAEEWFRSSSESGRTEAARCLLSLDPARRDAASCLLAVAEPDEVIRIFAGIGGPVEGDEMLLLAKAHLDLGRPLSAAGILLESPIEAAGVPEGGGEPAEEYGVIVREISAPLMEAGRFEDLEELYEPLGGMPGAVLADAGEAAFRRGEMDRAVRYLSEAPPAPETMETLVRIYLEGGETVSAGEVLGRLLEMEPMNRFAVTSIMELNRDGAANGTDQPVDLVFRAYLLGVIEEGEAGRILAASGNIPAALAFLGGEGSRDNILIKARLLAEWGDWEKVGELLSGREREFRGDERRECLELLAEAARLGNDRREEEEAVSLLAEMLPDSPALQTRLGRLRFGRGDSEGAIMAFRRALALDPRAPVGGELAALEVSEAIELINSGRIAAAHDLLTEAASLRPDDPTVRYNLGMVCSLLGFTDRALENLLAASELDPGDADIFLHIARLYRELGAETEAVAAFRSAIQNGAGARVRFEVGLLLMEDGDREGAMAFLGEAAGMDTGAADIQEAYGLLLSSEGSWEGALPFLERAAQGGRRASATLLALGRARLAAGDPDGARRAVSGLPRNAITIWINAESLRLEGDLEPAYELARQAYSLSPEDQMIRETLTEILVSRTEEKISTGDFSGAIEICNEWLEIDPESQMPRELIRAMGGRAPAANVMEEERDYEAMREDAARLISVSRPGEAMPILDELVRYEPRNTENWNLLGVARMRALDTAGARWAWSKSLRLDPEQDELREAISDLDGAGMEGEG